MMNLKRLHDTMRPEIDGAIVRVVDSSAFILGKEVEAFENEFASWLGMHYAAGVGSGTDAITLSLLALGIGAGDEVITTSLSAFPTAEAILRTGAVPVYVDVDPDTFNLDVSRIEERITPRTKAMVPVHLYGLPADLGTLMRIAEAHGLAVVEDCAQAHGAKYDGRLVGTFGRAACFSFFPSKNLGAMGDGGMVVTNDENIAKKVRALRAHGEEGGRFNHQYVGFNSRLSGLQAAILRIKLKHLGEHNRERQKIADFYHGELAGTDFILPKTPTKYPAEHVYHLYVIRVKEPGERDSLQEYLSQNDIKTTVHYPRPLHRQPAYATDESLPVVEKTVNQILSIPLFPTMTEEEMRYAVDVLKQWKPQQPKM